VVTNGKAGYRVLKLAGGQGDHEISLPVGSLIPFFFSRLFEVIGRNPCVLIFFISTILNSTK
tara:strand:- start:224 stop:409 length:186 start_codon:yes stop_codon:yes gene_type:complete